MKHEQYRELVNTYGVHPARWPEDRRVDALAYAYKHPQQAAKTNAGDTILDKALTQATLPDTDPALLMARILKTAQETPQQQGQHIKTPAIQTPAILTPANDHPTRFLADDITSPNPLRWKTLLEWKTLAATLLITMGIGFGLGQALSENPDYLAAETLLAFNNDTDSTALNWSEDNTGTNQ